MVVLITGHAGFIGFHTARKLLSLNIPVVGIDNLNDYYDVTLKKARLNQLKSTPQFTHYTCSVEDTAKIADIFANHKPTHVIHLAAQAGVRHSLHHPESYVTSNIQGFLSILESCRHHPVNHLVFASSSSVYGANILMPYAESHTTDHPLSFYGATKKANEVMAHAYSALYQIPTTGLRFFTVYGPWGRPDMALFKFTKALMDHAPLEVYNHGQMVRDFTYIDDIVEGIERVLNHIPTPQAPSSPNAPSNISAVAPFALYNIGRGEPQKLSDFIKALEDEIGRKGQIQPLPLQPGDSRETSACTENLFQAIGYQPKVSINEGIKNFVDWYCDYYKVNRFKK